ncbi:SDR family NAD(P)-dependent oxidoreductase [Abyssalbus ytuae]|uniref:SDR family NAD(P)-dependent oxidoreductase n=1 Tax=Abyssalbus ytuae TaxID=2926907 RepID=A0A9E6ZKV7_9FLAO|nr:SDR family NAD(P)-dependent oxidoreductase [Abyssalbus ytuae]UOB16085.1 SDR family NAD(P)-dependent oxidoreductase [Abyssalbus ytuae]
MLIGVLGCGWLGLPLATSLVREGWIVKGSTTSHSKLKDLEEKKIEPFLILINEHHITGNINLFLSNLDILIINIPPKLRSIPSANYVSKIKLLIKSIETNKVKKILFIGSTSIYANDNSIVTENTFPKPETESGTQLLETEQQLLSNKNFLTTILRFGGLFDEYRNPANFLAGKTNVANPKAAVNLIHKIDCIEIIKSIIKKDIWGETFNAAFPVHPAKNNYYTKKSLEAGLKPPTFNVLKPSKGKTIDSSKLINKLNYNFKKEL